MANAFRKHGRVAKKFHRRKRIVAYPGNCLDVLFLNVKSNHVEKTKHPCQFPVELIERLVLSLSNKGDCVLDLFLGAGTFIIAAVRHGRKGIGAESYPKYVKIARHRIGQELNGTLRTRPMGKAIYDPTQASNPLAKPTKKTCQQRQNNGT